jgi:hypothetical protein
MRYGVYIKINDYFFIFSVYCYFMVIGLKFIILIYIIDIFII